MYCVTIDFKGVLWLFFDVSDFFVLVDLPGYYTGFEEGFEEPPGKPGLLDSIESYLGKFDDDLILCSLTNAIRMGFYLSHSFWL